MHSNRLLKRILILLTVVILIIVVGYFALAWIGENCFGYKFNVRSVPNESSVMEYRINSAGPVDSYNYVSPDYSKQLSPDYSKHLTDIFYKPSNLPSEQDAINIAKDYVETHNLLPNESIAINVYPQPGEDYYPSNKTWKTDYNQAWYVDFVRTINGLEINGLGDGVLITVGDNGEVLKAQKTWHEISPDHAVNIKTVDQAYSELVNRNQSAVIMIPKTIPERVVIRNVTLAYYSEHQIPGEEQSQQYITPIYIFKGDQIDTVISFNNIPYEAWVKATEA